MSGLLGALLRRVSSPNLGVPVSVVEVAERIVEMHEALSDGWEDFDYATRCRLGLYESSLEFGDITAAVLQHGEEVCGPHLWNYLGAGAYNVVVRLPQHPGKVLRISRRRTQDDDDGDRSFEYYRFCMKKRGNPHYPRVYRVWEVGGFNCAIVEEMHKTASELGESIPLCSMVEGWVGGQPKLVRAIKELSKAFPHRFDLHMGNVMYRHGDDRRKVPVLTDPIV